MGEEELRHMGQRVRSRFQSLLPDHWNNETFVVRFLKILGANISTLREAFVSQLGKSYRYDESSGECEELLSRTLRTIRGRTSLDAKTIEERSNFASLYSSHSIAYFFFLIYLTAVCSSTSFAPDGVKK